ncbi:MFS family permease [Cryobacterium mesophilum]|uniref:MFS transporter n=1 Tax=Terrimesophilobacter mesophilus TaxID=433647 RepID=A0A4R8VE62_9MICO|nr:MFS transporter [Terrimesophilobacter mesophilus]MBB5633760.1 MFS family permease [Terrimesophilobacter mesophilus]TFB80442.1 MFS transporter [Terrimesophilobacter mesophilus]
MTHSTSAAPAALSEPTRVISAGWIALFATAWFGIWMAQLTPVQLLLPQQVEAHVISDNWVDKVVAFGIISGIAGVCALVAYPLTGALSDRTTSRFGRRRPWILAGALVFAASLVVLGMQATMVGIGILWSLAIIGFCMLTSALTATISDQVPVNQRGYVSGWLSAPQAVGTIVGLVLVIMLGLSQFIGYTLMAVLLIAFVLPFILRIPDAVLAPEDRPPFTMRALIAGFWISPRQFPDFGWTLLSRILVNFGNAFGTGLLLYFLQDGLGFAPGDPAQDALLILTLIYMVFVVAASLVLGRLSDRLGRRKMFVFTASALQALAALLLAFVPSFEVAWVAAGLLGLGYGCFLSVDQALATQVLPYAAARGKDLGIMNIATTVPQALAPLLGAFIVAALVGFQGLFLIAAIAALVGGLAVIPVRSVR